jgi:hypothetical protein
MMQIEETKIRSLRLADSTYETFSNACKYERMTVEGFMKKLLTNWSLENAKEEAK